MHCENCHIISGFSGFPKFKQFVAAIADLGVFWAVLNEPPPGSTKASRRYE